MPTPLRLYCSILAFLAASILAGQANDKHHSLTQVSTLTQHVKRPQLSGVPTFHKPAVQAATGLSNAAPPSSSAPISFSASLLAPEVRAQFEGNQDNGFSPSDNALAISDEGWIVSVVNSSVSFYKEDGSIALNSEDLNTFYGFLDFSGYYFNSRVIYDPVAGRFILATLIGETPESSHLVVSFSLSQNPGEGWWTYSYDDIGGSASTWMKDLQIGVSDHDLCLTGNLYDANNILSQSVVLYMTKELGYQGQNLNYCVMYDLSYNSGQAAWNLTPVSHGLGQGGIIILASKKDGGDTLQMISIIGNCESFDLLVIRSLIPVEYYTIGSNAAQLGSSKLLDVGDCRIQSAFYLGDTIYYVQHDQYSSGSNGFRYGKLCISESTHSFQRIGLQGNTYAYPSIAPFYDGNGDMNSVLIGFCRSSSSKYPEYDVISVASDFSYSAPVLVKAGETPITASIGNIVPWGSYSGISRRHNADLPTAWVHGSYGKDGAYGNWIAEIIPLGSGLNNPCEQAVQVSCGVTVAGSTSGGNPQILTNCGGALNTAPGKWYRLVGNGSNVTLSTCNAATNFNTKIAVFTGSCSNLVCQAGADDTGCGIHPDNTTLSFYAQDGEEYFIYVTGAGIASGNFELSVTCVQDPPSCSGNQVFTTCNGTISDGSGSSPCSNNLSCSWRISPPGATAVTLNFTAFDTENNFDVVRVYDGLNAGGVLLDTFSGSTLPGPLTATSGNMFIVFETDGSANSVGWAANYTCAFVPPPSAAFTANPSSGNAPLSVNFTNTSTNATSYSWSFPGGTPASSTNISPQNILFSTPGTYTVTLTATGPGGTSTSTATITVNTPNAPIVAFSANPSSGFAPLTVDFTNNTVNASSYSWNFPGGNPSSSNATNPQDIVFATPGVYTVTLTATGPGGTASQTATITVSGTPPTANFSSSSTCVQVGTGPVQFNDLSQNTPTSWAWSFPGGTPATSSLPNPSVTYGTPGVYDVVLTVSNASGTNTLTKTGHVTVVDVKAQPLNGDTLICLGESLLLSASGAGNFLWQGPGITGSGAVVSVTPTNSGSAIYTVVGITGSCSDAPVTLSIQVNPLPNVSVQVSTNEICEGESVTMTAQGAETYKWTGAGLNTTTSETVIATPTTSGNFAYTVKGTSNGCISLVQTVNIFVKAAPIVNLASSSPSICLGEQVTLIASGASQYLWIGPGIPANPGSVVVVTPVSTGTAAYIVIGTGANGCTAQNSTQVMVNGMPVVQASANPGTICLGNTVILSASGAQTYHWSGPNLLSNTGQSVLAIPSQAGTLVYHVYGVNSDSCEGPVTDVLVNVVDNPLSVTVLQSGCPGPNLSYEAQVVNGGSINNISWYVNGGLVWNGPTYTYVNAVPGSQLYCTVAPQNPPACSHPSTAQSPTITVGCVPVEEDMQVLPELSLLPNPNNGVFQLKVNAFEPIELQLRAFNSVGQIVLHQTVDVHPGSQSFLFDLSERPEGWYWMEISSGNRNQTVPFVKL